MDNEEIQPSTELEVENEVAEIVSIHSICRLCANQNDKLIGFFSEEGISNDLSNKINLYLPIKISENDDLPLQCCWSCASTLLAWHELVIASVESDRRFRSYQFITEKHIVPDINFEGSTDAANGQNEGMEPEPMPTSLNDFCQTESATQLVQNFPEDKKTVKQMKKKKKQDLITYYPPQEASNSLETYISGIEHHFIVDNNLPETSEHVNEYKIDIEENNILVDEDNKDHNLRNLNVPHELGNSDDDEHFSSESVKPDEETVYACHYCSAVFVLKKDVFNHIQKDHPGSEYVPPIAQHIPEQKLKKERRKNCKIDQDVTNAAKVVVDGRIYYNCKECGKSLHSPYTYIWHMRIHTGERPYVCDLCGKQFRVSQGLVRHLRETHQGIKKFPCDLCGRMFATRRNVEEHRRIHTNERPYICDLCGKSFKQKASLFVHKRSHKNYFPFKCSYCNQGFRTKPPLMVHITRHTGEKPYKCETCGRCFRIKYELKRHRLIHSDEKPFICPLCGLSFRQKRYLRNHTKSNHTLAAT